MLESAHYQGKFIVHDDMPEEPLVIDITFEESGVLSVYINGKGSNHLVCKNPFDREDTQIMVNIPVNFANKEIPNGCEIIG